MILLCNQIENKEKEIVSRACLMIPAAPNKLVDH
jgi:hypothetical protein